MSTSACHAVSAASGIVAAWVWSSPAGLRAKARAGPATYSAQEP
ncbi:hypothetical protein ACWEKR_03000 [Nocardia sp. NPDC004573]